MKSSIFLMLLTPLLLSGGYIFAAETADPANLPLHITSDVMTSDQSAAIVEFSGNVVATRDDGTIHADFLKVFFAGKSVKAGEKQSIDRIEATGNVIYEAENRKAYSDKAVYKVKDQVLVLTGEAPRVDTGSSFVTGKTITLYRLSGKVLVEGGSKQRVEAQFNPQELKKKSGN
ncbi:MAG: lipopolysaccharide transport periplasmic protein LptA [Pseudomonadota bacterium]